MGCNQKGAYYINANFGRDFDIPENGDISQLNEGDHCMSCGSALESLSAFEMGNIFKLDDYYTRKMEFPFHDLKGKLRYPFMGAYGLGLGRLMSCIAEANRDNKGRIWPVELAPYTFYLMGIGKSPRINSAVDEIAEELGEDEVLVDDRRESIGIKFRDADLLGIPLRMVVSRLCIEKGEIELKDRRTGRKWFIKRENLKEEIKKWREECRNSLK
jgi:prolyl-tRNA synthetase